MIRGGSETKKEHVLELRGGGESEGEPKPLHNFTRYYMTRERVRVFMSLILSVILLEGQLLFVISAIIN